MVTLLAIGIFNPLNAQNDASLTSNKVWYLKGMAKSALRLGDTHQAATYLTEWQKHDAGNIRLAYLLGYCHEMNRNYGLATQLYDSLYKAAPRSNIFALYKLGLMNKYGGMYEEAIECFTQAAKYQRKLTVDGVLKKQLAQQLAGCQLALRWQDSVANIGIMRLDTSINHMHKETGPVIVGDSMIVYGSTWLNQFECTDIQSLSRPTNQVYSAYFKSGKWQGGYPSASPSLSMTGFDWAKGVYSLDGRRFYASYCSPNLRGKMHCKLYVSEKTANGWTAPKVLGKNINHRKYSSSQPSIGTCYNTGLEVIYFTSDRPRGAGKKDIWFTVYNKQTQSYSKAQNAGVYINTASDEMAPFYDLTTHRLFFSSDGWPGLGGLDIFKSKGDMVTWEEPENVGLPLNSSCDDVDYAQTESGKMGFLASNRPDDNANESSTCCDDLFTFSETINPRVKVSGHLVKQRKSESLDRMLGKGPEQLNVAGETSVLANKVITIHTIRDSSTVIFLKQAETDENGNFSVWVEKGADYKIMVKDTSLLAASFDFSTVKATNNDLSEVEIKVAPLKARPLETIEINNIYYDFGSSDLSSSAKTVLDTTLLVLMKRYPSITVEIGSHTDNKGGERLNQRLSEKRAGGVVAYLIEQGISPKRLHFKGYGMSVPIAPNAMPDGTDNPEGRQQNRRTEFRIVGVLTE
jgi:OOP family OmpA-OmpF porin